VSERATSDESSRPRLAAHRRLRYDEARKSWTIQAPERVFLLDEIAYAIVGRCDGRKTVREIVDELCAAFQAPRDVVEADVQKLVREFANKGVMAL
jgi:pyrroloquinoline quinone biosynthesis protein D